MNVAVVGIGRIGLPVATGIAARGHSVVGCDIDERRVAMVNKGENPIPDEAGLGELLAEVVRAGNLRATTGTAAAVAEASTVLFAVAVDVDRAGHADLTSLLAACDAVASGTALLDTIVAESAHSHGYGGQQPDKTFRNPCPAGAVGPGCVQFAPQRTRL